MTYWTYAPQDFTSFNRRGFFRRVLSEAAPGAVVLGLAALAGAWIVYVHPDAQIRVVEAPIEAPTLEAASLLRPQVAAQAVRTPAAPVHVAANVYSPFIDPTFSLKAARASFAQSAPLASTFGEDPEALSPSRVAAIPTQLAAIPMPPVEPQALVAPRVPADDVDTQDKSAQDDQSGKENVLPLSGDQNLAASAPLPPAHMVASVPLPAPRPDGLVVPEAENHTRVAVRQAPQPKETTQVAAAPTPPQDHNSFFDKLFGGINRPSGQALAYAESEDGVVDTSKPVAAVLSPYDHYTAVYNIATHTVYLPDGRRLEAHSGLGEAFDDPRYVRQKMRGPTPPGVYDLQPREQLFHGVAALRLVPVGGDPYGRVGLLAHRFMLGPRGDSNGCVSFRNYPAFLDAFRNGEVRRLVVVAGL
ncbi:uncharacterized protein DUF2778 [Methylovirgula ligni]|uniref:Uncharacterized protein DUF2778 n=1 Tax=Methylovirgula ligni TaxID=569860 RepID=A0A3D9YYB6_9HYPH|nr:tlde1 domain-containing protein [Methylovirgula ligni]REF87365.1 uncharacterized protein DUF2778 [Methylovirgula ligni]